MPAWDLKTLYVTNDLDNSLTPVDPFTAKPSGPNVPVADPYNLYFTPDGRAAIVVAEAQRRLDFRDPHSFSLLKALPVDCPGVDHIDFSSDGSYLVATCEFSAKLVKVDLRSRAVVGYLKLAGSSPQDIKLDAAGQVFYVADRTRGGSTRLRPRHSGRSDSCPPARTPTASIPVATGGRSTSPIVVPGRSP